MADPVTILNLIFCIIIVALGYWEYHKNTDYEWWIKRIEYSFKLYDIVRIDHFRGFDKYSRLFNDAA